MKKAANKVMRKAVEHGTAQTANSRLLALSEIDKRLGMAVEVNSTFQRMKRIRRPTDLRSDLDQAAIDNCLGEACYVMGSRLCNGYPDTPSKLQMERGRLNRIARGLLYAIQEKRV